LFKKRTTFESNAGVKSLEEALQKEWYAKIIATLCLSAAGLAGLWLGIQWSAILALFGLILTTLALRLFYTLMQQLPVSEHRLMKLLREHPRQIVWVYSVVTQRMPFGLEIFRSGLMYFKLADGKEITVELPADRLKGVAEHLNDLLPHASFGYTRDREQWYMAEPLMLLVEPENENPS
jgi:hypothetical protein